MSKYLIGIDGGGTKTLGVLFNKDGTEVKRYSNGFANFSVDEEQTKINLIDTIDNLLIDIDPKDILHIELGVSGVSKLQDKSIFVNALKERYQTSVDLVSDAEIALYSIKRKATDCTIMVIGGTGSILMISEDNKNSVIGGFGHILGDEGSGYHLAITALKGIIKEYEENLEISQLSKEILKEINASNYFDIKNFVYGSSKNRIAELSAFISNFAVQGNKDAIKLFVEEGKHLARQTMSAVNKIETCQQIIIGIRGGFLLNAPYVKQTFIEELNNNKINYKIDVNPVEPVYGAFKLGLTKIVKR